MWATFTIAGVGLIFVGLGLAIWLGSTRWDRKTSRLVEKVSQTTGWGELKRVDFKQLDQLPAPVARYFRLALKEGQPYIRSARATQLGEIRLRETDDKWRPFEAEQYFSSLPPGFVWDASIRMAPLMNVRVRDAYVAGQGLMQAQILSLVSMVDDRGKAELNAGALQRYLAEAVWFPTALLPGEGVRWSPIDESCALATLTDSGTTVSLEFRFNDSGEVTGVFTPGRFRAVDGKYELTPWAGQFANYQERAGMRIPLDASVEWHLATGIFNWWRGRIVEVEYDFAR